LDGTICLVTGAAGGIGSEIVRAYLSTGASVVAADIQVDALADRLGDLSIADAGRLDPQPVDVTDPDSVHQLAAHTASKHGRVDLVVNNAGIVHVDPLLDLPFQTWQKVFAVNVHGAFLLTQAAARKMVHQEPHAHLGRRGMFINVSSGAAGAGRPMLAAYGASKAALNHLTRSSAAALGDQLVASCALYPGNVKEGMWSYLGGLIADAEGRTADDVEAERVFQPAGETAAAALLAASSVGMELNDFLVVAPDEVRPLAGG
jgi:NAD(P)-dependent dehydrogenase (short-subunit alcohol dehydrogenase family)